MKIWLNGKKQSVISKFVNDSQSESEKKAGTDKSDEFLNEIVIKIEDKAKFLLQLAQPASFRSETEETD